MNAVDLLKFFLGDAGAIRAVAYSPDALWLGALFVLSAALARTWQRINLRTESKYLALPFVASLASSLIFTLAFAVWCFGSIVTAIKIYPMILRVFWMTAPLAWIYGFPFEKSSTRVKAVKRRMWALLLVSVWRMVLTMRLLVVLCNLPAGSAVTFVIIYGAMVALVAIHFTTPRSVRSVPMIVEIMSGVSPNELPEVNVLKSVTGCLAPLLILALPVCLVMLLGFSSTVDVVEPAPDAPAMAVSSELWGFGLLAVLFWTVLLPRAQQKQRLKSHIDRLVQSGQYEQAVSVLHSHRQNDLPNQWVPPLAEIWNGQHHERLRKLTQAAHTLPIDSWVVVTMKNFLTAYVRDPLFWWFKVELCGDIVNWTKFAGIAAEDAADVLKQLDDLKSLIESNRSRRTQRKEALREEGRDEGDDEFIDDANLIHAWPEITETRRTLLEYFKNVAGELYRGPEASDGRK